MNEAVLAVCIGGQGNQTIMHQWIGKRVEIELYYVYMKQHNTFIKIVFGLASLSLFALAFFSNVQATDSFVTTWKTDNPGTSSSNQILIPTRPELTYDYDVDWGDGTTDTHVTGDGTHTYESAGTYQVTITGTFPAIYFNESNDAQKIVSVDQWGTNHWLTFSYAFAGCTNLNILATDVPDLSGVTDMSGMFRGAVSFNQSIGSWDVSHVTNMASMFKGAISFNQPLSSWNVSNVTSMSAMFSNASAYNYPLDTWVTSQVTDFSDMFNSAASFQQDISSWNVTSATTMSNMFSNIQFQSSIYDAMLTNWSTQSVQTGVAFSGGLSKYCNSTEAHDTLTGSKGWMITDGGSGCVYKVSYGAGTHAQVSGVTSQFVLGGNDATEITASADNGYHFSVWSDGSYENPRTDTNIQSDMSVTASAQLGDYTIREEDAFITSGSTANITVSMTHGGFGTAPTKFGIRYSLDSSESWDFQAVTILDSFSPGNYSTSVELKSLTCSKTYKYQAFITNGMDSDAYSSIKYLTMPECTLPTIATESASNILETSAILNGTITSVGSISFLTSYKFEYGENTEYGSEVVSENGEYGVQNLPGLTISNLACHTTYHYRAVGVYKENGEEVYIYGDDATVQTRSCSGGGGGGDSESLASISNLGPVSVVNKGTTSNVQPTLSFTIDDNNAAPSGYLIALLDSPVVAEENAVIIYMSPDGGRGERSFTVGQPQGEGEYQLGSEGQHLVVGKKYYWIVAPFGAQGGPEQFVLAWDMSDPDSYAFQVTAQEENTTPVSAPSSGGVAFVPGLLNLSLTPVPSVGGNENSNPAQNSQQSPQAAALAKPFQSFLQFGMFDAEIQRLQHFLNTAGFAVSSNGNPGSLGHETNYFGPRTYQALIKFQKAKGIIPASGYFGPKTKEYINSQIEK